MLPLHSTCVRITNFLRTLAFLVTLASFTIQAGAQSAPWLSGILDDGLNHAPPAIGSLAYNSFVLPLMPGASYVDPVFGTTVRRLTTDHVEDDIYATNMRWNADETRYLHRTTNGTPWPDYWDVIDVATGQVTHRGLPNGAAISAGDGGFDPVDPDVLYYYGSDGLHKITLGAGGTWTDQLYFTPPGGAPLKSLGGTLNWLDASGRYLLVRYGAEPSVYLYDRQNLAAGPYGNPLSGALTVDTNGYLGLSPDGQFIVGYEDQGGFYGIGQGVSWRIDHASRTLPATKTVFWSLCGDHGSFLSASDGRTYMIVNECNFKAELWRVDVTNNAAGLDEPQQRALPNNRLLLAYPTWNDFGHYSTVAKGPLRDWAFLSTEDGGDAFNSGGTDTDGTITPWHAYRQEIVGINVLTGEIRRLAHHRSRSLNLNYYYQPRISATWSGKYVGFPSNFNQDGTVDVYAVQFSSALDTTPPTVAITAPLLGVTVSGTTTVSASATDDVGVAGVQFKLDGNNLGAEVATAPYSIAWNTLLASNGLHALTAVARDAAGNTATALAVSVTVSNLLDTTPPVISSVASSNVSSMGATIVWTTDEAGDSQVEYGQTTAYGSSTALNSSLVTAHSQGLSGLAAGTLYHYRVKSRDAAGNLAVSADFTFTTSVPPADAVVYRASVPATVDGVLNEWSGATAVSFSGRSNSATAYVLWDSANLYLAFKVLDTKLSATRTARDAADLYRDDSVEVYLDTRNDRTATMQSDDYQFLVNLRNVKGDLRGTGSGKDASWNATWQSAVKLQGTLNSNGDTDSWSIVEIAIPWAQIGVTPVSDMVIGIDLAVDDRDPNSTPSFDYFDWAGIAPNSYNQPNRWKQIRLVNIPPPLVDTTPPAISAVASSNVTSTGATITWTTNEASDSQVEYGPTTAYGSSAALNTSLVTAHSQGLSGLSANTLYHYRVKSKDASGNLATSGDFTFTTQVASSSGPQNVIWSSLVNATATGNTLQKTSGCNGCDDAGAVSSQTITSGDGYVEFTVGETNSFWYGGLSQGNPGTTFDGINFAFRFNGAGGADVAENGVYKGGSTPYAVGDVFRVAVEAGQVKFRKNGVLLYTGVTAPTYPLLLDTALGTVNGTVQNAKISLGP